MASKSMNFTEVSRVVQNRTLHQLKPGWLDLIYLYDSSEADMAAPHCSTLREPRMVMDPLWGRAYNHLYRDQALLTLGVDVNTAIEFTATGAQVWGENTVVVFDGRYASYALGQTTR